MFEINLVPEVQKQKQQLAQKNTIATIVAVSVLGVVILAIVILGSLKVAANISLGNTKERIEAVKVESENYSQLQEDVISLENGLTGIKQTLDGQNTWTVVLPHLEAATPSDVQFTSLTLEGNTLKAQLKGRSVESVARFIESYKNYQVIVMTGTGTPQEEVSIVFDGGTPAKATVKSDGTWIYATKIDLNENHTVEITSGTEVSKISYNASTQKITTEQGTASARVENLFSGIETKQYSKEGSTVTFDATLTVQTGVLW